MVNHYCSVVHWGACVTPGWCCGPWHEQEGSKPPAFHKHSGWGVSGLSEDLARLWLKFPRVSMPCQNLCYSLAWGDLKSDHDLFVKAQGPASKVVCAALFSVIWISTTDTKRELREDLYLLLKYFGKRCTVGQFNKPHDISHSPLQRITVQDELLFLFLLNFLQKTKSSHKENYLAWRTRAGMPSSDEEGLALKVNLGRILLLIGSESLRAYSLP